MGQIRQVFVNVAPNGASFKLELRYDNPNGPVTEDSLDLRITEDGSDQDTVNWVCTQGPMEVLFDPNGVGATDAFGDPAGRRQNPAGIPIQSGPPLNEAAGPHLQQNGFNGTIHFLPHKYTIKVNYGGVNVVKDPYVMVSRPRPVLISEIIPPARQLRQISTPDLPDAQSSDSVVRVRIVVERESPNSPPRDLSFSVGGQSIKVLRLRADQQIEWLSADGPTGKGVHLELRFDPRSLVFPGHHYEAGAGAPCSSGAVRRERLPNSPLDVTYWALATTVDGYFIARSSSIEIVNC